MKLPRRVTEGQWLLIAVGVFFLLVFIAPRGPASENVDISQVIQMAKAGQIEKIEAKGDKLTVTATEERVIAGPARKSRKVSERERKIVAYHEGGHALVASRLPDSDPVHKVTIVARGTSGGHTRLFPKEDRGLWSKGQIEAMLAVMMGGQAAEEAAFGEVTTRASGDLRNTTTLARKMVAEYGMSSELGPQIFDDGNDEIFLGKELVQRSRYSDAVAQKIDKEVGSLLRTARATARRLIEFNRAGLNRLAEKLLRAPEGDAAIAA